MNLLPDEIDLLNWAEDGISTCTTYGLEEDPFICCTDHLERLPNGNLVVRRELMTRAQLDRFVINCTLAADLEAAP